MFKDDLRAKFNRGKALFKRRRFEEACRCFEELDSATPNMPEILYAYARCLIYLKRYEEASRLANRLQTMHSDPRGPMLNHRIAELQAREE